MHTASRRNLPGGLPTPAATAPGDRSEDEVSEEEEEPCQQELVMESSTAAVEKSPGQPGKSSDNLSFSNALQDLLGVVTTGAVAPLPQLMGQAPDQQLADKGSVGSGSGGQLQELLEGLRVLVGRFGGEPGQTVQAVEGVAPQGAQGDGRDVTPGVGVQVTTAPVVPAAATSLGLVKKSRVKKGHQRLQDGQT